MELQMIIFTNNITNFFSAVLWSPKAREHCPVWSECTQAKAQWLTSAAPTRDGTGGPQHPVETTWSFFCVHVGSLFSEVTFYPGCMGHHAIDNKFTLGRLLWASNWCVIYTWLDFHVLHRKIKFVLVQLSAHGSCVKFTWIWEGLLTNWPTYHSSTIIDHLVVWWCQTWVLCLDLALPDYIYTTWSRS